VLAYGRRTSRGSRRELQPEDGQHSPCPTRCFARPSSWPLNKLGFTRRLVPAGVGKAFAVAIGGKIGRRPLGERTVVDGPPDRTTWYGDRPQPVWSEGTAPLDSVAGVTSTTEEPAAIQGRGMEKGSPPRQHPPAGSAARQRGQLGGCRRAIDKPAGRSVASHGIAVKWDSGEYRHRSGSPGRMGTGWSTTVDNDYYTDPALYGKVIPGAARRSSSDTAACCCDSSRSVRHPNMRASRSSRR